MEINSTFKIMRQTENREKQALYGILRKEQSGLKR